MSSIGEASSEMTSLNSWNLKSLRVETDKEHARTFKKIGRILERQRREENSSSEETKEESCSSYREEDILALQSRLQRLEALSSQLRDIPSTNSEDFARLIPDIRQLNITSENPKTANITPRKTKPSKPAPRKPYHTYTSADGIEIRVGREAADNDQLSTDPALRDDDEWWLHASEVAGSHVVIRCKDDDLPSRWRSTVMDAALLAVVNSKAKNAGGRVQVSLTRCRNVSKPRGAKPGLVYLDGDIRMISVDIKAERGRLERLKKV
jgi:predicted ribosome quality control (RQC) complex YloA/Tae2 family protein